MLKIQVFIMLLVCVFRTQAATLTFDGSGRLSGALGVEVGGLEYDVSFVDGTCASAYPSCSAGAAFFVDSLQLAVEAAEQLQLQVFNMAGAVTVVGCSGSFCQAWIPYLVDASDESGSSAFTTGGLGTYTANTAFDTTLQPSITRSIWSPSAGQLPAQNIPALPAVLMAVLATALLRISMRTAAGVKRR